MVLLGNSDLLKPSSLKSGCGRLEVAVSSSAAGGRELLLCFAPGTGVAVVLQCKVGSVGVPSALP